MTEIIGKIEAVEMKQASTGSQYAVYQIKGKKYNIFNLELNKFGIGDFVKLTLEQKGKYSNVVNVEQASESPQISVSEPAIERIVITRVIKPHSYEFGKPSARHKIYYDTIEELKAHIDALNESGLLIETPDDPEKI